jgi:hypothetical protein
MYRVVYSDGSKIPGLDYTFNTREEAEALVADYRDCLDQFGECIASQVKVVEV